MKCAHCSNPLDPGVTVCPKCGLTTTPLRDGDEKTVHGVKLTDVLVGRYRLDQKIGEGGMGTVYLAHDKELDRLVAIKLLARALVDDAEVVERFEREAKLTAKLDHPNVVPIYDVGRHQNRPFIVMKKLEGDTLAGVLRNKGGLRAEETLKLIEQVALGLDFVHSKGFIHRDVKAGNIFVGPDNKATILDFGILRPKQGGDPLTRTGMVMGTPHYMAPEQALGSKDVDHRVDLYALAVVAFEALSGTLPFEADSELRLIQMQAHQPPPDLLERAPWIPKPVAEVMKRALAKRADDRFSSGAEFHRALKDAYAKSNQPGVNDSKPPSWVPPKVAPHTAPSWRNRTDEPGASPSASGEAAPPFAALSSAAPASAIGPAQPVQLPPSGAMPVIQGTPISETGAKPNASGPDTDDFKRAVRPNRWPMMALGAVALVAALVFFLKPWDSTGHPLPIPKPSDPLANTTAPVDAGVAIDDGSDAGGSAVAIADGLDAGSGVATPEDTDDDGGLEAIDLTHPRNPANPNNPANPANPDKRIATPVRVDTHGKLNVVTLHGGEPYWAQVSIDGKLKGRTPLLLDLPVGKYLVKVERPGFKSEVREVRVASGRQAMLKVDLTQ